MKRRNFLRSSSFLTLPMLVNGLPVAAAGRNAFTSMMDDENDKVLVLIQLNGGNDGLQTIIPLDQYDLLANVRSNIVVPEASILPIESAVGLHPNMTGIRSLYDDARMAVIQDVGYPNQNRSHFRSTDIWTSASAADEFVTTGWLGRHFQTVVPDYPEGYPNATYPDPFALTIGSVVSETCQGTITNFSLALTDPLSIAPLTSGGDDEVPDNYYGSELSFLRTTIKQANAYGDPITTAAEKGVNISSKYDDNNRLHQQLKSIALLVAGGLRTKVYIANLGGFDTHANQVTPGNTANGDHGQLLQTLSDAVEAFQDDLALLDLEDRVLTMTFSEFGRRIRSNDSFGTDHGTAAPILVFGKCVKSGILGDTPTLPENPSGSDGVPMQFDFRNVYGTVLQNWLGVEEGVVKTLLFQDFTTLPFIESCEAITSITNPEIQSLEVVVYPNPFRRQTRIEFESNGEQLRISLFDAMGSEIRVLSDRFFTAGTHKIDLETGDLPSGNYFLRLFGKHALATQTLVKI